MKSRSRDGLAAKGLLQLQYCTWIPIIRNLRELQVNFNTSRLNWLPLPFVKRPENAFDFFTELF